MTPEEADSHFEYVPIGTTQGWEYSVLDGRVDICQVNLSGSMAYEIASDPRGIRIIELPLDDRNH